MNSRAAAQASVGGTARGQRARVGVIALCAFASAFAEAPETCTPRPVSENAPIEQGGESDRLVSAPDASETWSTGEKRQHAERFIHEKLAIWRKQLALEDWQVSIVMTRRDALKSRTLGGIRWDKGKKSAVISVLDVSEYRVPFREMLEDMEFTVVHELVHLELASLPRSEASRSKEEHAVNRLTAALLTLARDK